MDIAMSFCMRTPYIFDPKWYLIRFFKHLHCFSPRWYTRATTAACVYIICYRLVSTLMIIIIHKSWITFLPLTLNNHFLADLPLELQTQMPRRLVRVFGFFWTGGGVIRIFFYFDLKARSLLEPFFRPVAVYLNLKITGINLIHHSSKNKTA